MNTLSNDMLIGDILRKFPEAAEVMESYGLHCTSCSVNTMEPVKAGAMAHGIPEETVNEMLMELNQLAENSGRKIPADGVYLTEKAARKIEEFAANENKKGFALRVTAEDNEGNEPAYMMEFEEKSKEGDKVFEFHGVSLYIDEASMKNLMGAEVDFVETPFASGFKIDNPNFKKKHGGCGCGGNGSCSTGGGCGSEGGGGGCGCAQ